MSRKKWTPKTEITHAVLKFRAKRKWQIALRRYLIEKNKCLAYAPYFGIDIINFRKWIEIQFDEDLNWTNFSAEWQLDHIVPVTFFDFDCDSDLRLCWNFTNVRPEKLKKNKDRGNRLDISEAKIFFKTIYETTNYLPAFQMIQKIDQIEISEIASTQKQQEFLINNKDYLKMISDFSEYEFDKLNFGASTNEILEERKFFEKFS